MLRAVAPVSPSGMLDGPDKVNVRTLFEAMPAAGTHVINALPVRVGREMLVIGAGS